MCLVSSNLSSVSKSTRLDTSIASSDILCIDTVGTILMCSVSPHISVPPSDGECVSNPLPTISNHLSTNRLRRFKSLDFIVDMSVRLKLFSQANANISKSLFSNAPKFASVKYASLNPAFLIERMSLLTMSKSFLSILVSMPPPHSQYTHL